MPDMPPYGLTSSGTTVAPELETVPGICDSKVTVPVIKVYKRLRRIHLGQSVETLRARVKLFVLSGEKLLT